jgi:glyoxylase-like metal-dependent hydrolase (beta-lactamase superfamily II)
MTMKVDKLGDNFYTVTGMNGSGRTGGAIGVLTGPDGILMVDASFGPLTGKMVTAVKTFSNEPIKFLVNTHPHGDHTGGNPNLAKMGVTILGRTEMRVDLMAQKGFGRRPDGHFRFAADPSHGRRRSCHHSRSAGPHRCRQYGLLP